MTENNVIAKKSLTSYIASITFLGLALLITIVLHFYNNYLWSEIEDIKTDIVSIESNISEVEKDKSLQVYSLLELNKTTINSYEIMNKVTKYINHMNVIKAKYSLEFNWFNLSNWKIITIINIESDNKWIAYQKTRDFINKYRNDSKALFELDFINWVEWMDNMKFKANFNIK